MISLQKKKESLQKLFASMKADPDFRKTKLKVWGERKTFSNVMKHTAGETGLAAVQVWESLVGIITGRFGIQHLSGPVGVTEAVGESIKVGIAPDTAFRKKH